MNNRVVFDSSVKDDKLQQIDEREEEQDLPKN